MRKIVKILIFVTVLTFVNTNLFGAHKQDTALVKQVKITKSYTPKISTSIKKDIEPDKVTRLRIKAPIFDYSIAYKPQIYTPSINTLESIEISTAEYENTEKGFIKIAIGYPFQSIADLYYNANPTNNLFLAGGISHKGFWGELINDMNNIVGAMNTQNSIFGMLEHKDNDFLFKSNLKYSNQIYTPYGVFLPVKPAGYDFKINRNIYNIIDFDFRLGTPLNLRNSFNWALYSDVNYFNDNHNFNEILFTIGLDLDFSIKNRKHIFGLNMDYKLHAPIWGSKHIPNNEFINEQFDPYFYLAKQNTHYITIKPGYFRNGEISALEFNVSIIAKVFNGKSQLEAILPNLKYTIFTDRISASAGIKSNSEILTHNNLIKENPYLLSGVTAKTIISGDLFIGIEGSASSWFFWAVEGGGRFQYNTPYFLNILDGNTFTVNYDKPDELIPFWFADVSVSAMLMSKLVLSLNYKYQSLDLYTYAKHNFTIDAKYKIKENWIIKLGGELLSDRDLIGIYNAPVIDNNIVSQTKTQVASIPTKFYLSFGLEYNINNKISITADLNNILNSKMYQFNHYPELGINGMVGITLKF